jgi:CRP-like cAMP-binding protein
MLAQAHERNAFLSELSPAEFAMLRTHLAHFEMRVGESLHCFGDLVEDVVFPHSGLVALTMPLHDNPGAAAMLIGREGIVGAVPATALAPATSDAEVHIGGPASRMSAATFRYIVEQNPTIRRRLARFTNATLVHAQQTALCHAKHSVEARICRWLLEVQDRSGSSKVPLTQSTLAQMLGVRRTTVTLVAGRLEAAGVLKCHRGYVQIISQGELARHSCECYDRLRGYLAKMLAAPDEAASALNADGRQRPGRTAL